MELAKIWKITKRVIQVGLFVLMVGGFSIWLGNFMEKSPWYMLLIIPFCIITAALYIPLLNEYENEHRNI